MRHWIEYPSVISRIILAAKLSRVTHKPTVQEGEREYDCGDEGARGGVRKMFLGAI